ncbi:MAG: homocysteine S-methyltransferase family protein [Candidatus Zixiibacteriota bacterium]
MAHPFLERLRKGVMLCDGAMGTLLYMRGVSFKRSFEELNLSNPQMVLEVHRDYIKAGAEIIETNTFGANAVRLRDFGLEKKVREINLMGAEIAREAREKEGKGVFVAGSMGPMGKPATPPDEISEKEVTDIFQKQAESLLQGGVDLVILETFSDTAELMLAVSAVRNICQLPIIASMTFNEEGKTFNGQSAAEAGYELNQMEVEIIGANCSAGPLNMPDITKSLSQVSSKMLSIQPSAGIPRHLDGGFIYPASPEYFTECVRDCIIAGADIIGGCCGTTPEYIRSLSLMLRNSNSAATNTKSQTE